MSSIYHYVVLDEDDRVRCLCTSQNFIESPRFLYYTDEEFKVGDTVDRKTKTVVIPAPAPPPQKILPEYVVSRKNAYPTVGDQLDMLWKAMDANPATRVEPFYSTIQNVKNQFPKPV